MSPPSDMASFEGARREVSYAYAKTRFFREHMDAAGLAPDSIASPDDLRRIPPTRRAQYRRHFPAHVLADGRSLGGRFVQQARSSGTAGERIVTATETFVLAGRMHTTTAAHPELLRYLTDRPRRRTCRYAAPNCSDVECATPGSPREDRTLPDGTLVLPVHHDLLATSEAMLETAVIELVDHRPDWLYADPTHLSFLARYMKRRSIAPPDSCGAVVLTYTRCTAVARRQLAAFFDKALLVSFVSMSEFGWIAMECPRGQLHLNASAFYPEFLVGDRPARPGELSELVLTSVGDRLSPHIRYRTSDYYRPLERSCPCGHPSPIASHEGRWRDMIRHRGRVLLTPASVDRIVGDAGWLWIYQVEQVREDHVLFRYAPADDGQGDGQAERVREALQESLGPDVRVDLERATYLAGERSGKFSPCRSRLGDAGDPAEEKGDARLYDFAPRGGDPP